MLEFTLYRIKALMWLVLKPGSELAFVCECLTTYSITVFVSHHVLNNARNLDLCGQTLCSHLMREKLD